VGSIKKPKIIKEVLTPYYRALQATFTLVKIFLAEIILIIAAFLYYCTTAEHKTFSSTRL
jgi:hypothetical protein